MDYGNRPGKLKKALYKIAVDAGFKILNVCEHYFNPYGYTVIFLLAESHLAVHTFPEENKTYIEISSCNEQKYEAFKKMIAEYGHDISG